MIPVTTFAGKTAAVFGLGASGVATARALMAGGAQVAAWDDSEASRGAAEKAGVPLVDLRSANWTGFAALVLAPGVPLTHPEPHWSVKAAKAAGVEVIGDIELFCRERRIQPFHVPFVAVTGTNGKSTTTALVAHVLRELGQDVEMGGNIGVPILALARPAPDRVYVIEMSSFQIELTPSLDPTIGVLLNVTPDHLDRHGTVENYAALKERLLANAETACIGADDPITRAIAERTRERGGVAVFSAERVLDDGYCADGPELALMSPSPRHPKKMVLAHIEAGAALRGRHNAQNAVAALAAVRELGERIARSDELRGRDRLRLLSQARLLDWAASPGDPSASKFNGPINSFPGLPHRMEEIGRLGRVAFVNDSKATNADSTEKALLSWERNIYWIAGGRPKEGGITSLAPLFPRVAKAYLIGEAAEDFGQKLAASNIPFEQCGTLDRAVDAAARDAARSAGEEPVVLLSPACASYDQFKNFEERGEAFRQIVSRLPGFEPKPKSPAVGIPPTPRIKSGGGSSPSPQGGGEPPILKHNAVPGGST